MVSPSPSTPNPRRLALPPLARLGRDVAPPGHFSFAPQHHILPTQPWATSGQQTPTRPCPCAWSAPRRQQTSPSHPSSHTKCVRPARCASAKRASLTPSLPLVSGRLRPRRNDLRVHLPLDPPNLLQLLTSPLTLHQLLHRQRGDHRQDRRYPGHIGRVPPAGSHD